MATPINLRDRQADRDDGCPRDGPGGPSCLRCLLLPSPCIHDVRDGTVPHLPDRRPGMQPTSPPELLAPGRVKW